MELTEDKKNLNFVLWVDKLKGYNCYSESLVLELGERIKNAPFNMNEINGGAYSGALIETILTNLCVIGYHINELSFGFNKDGKRMHPFLNVNTEMLVRVLLLQHISKAIYYIEQTESWKKNKGFNYEYNCEVDTQLKFGEMSAFLCMKHGIELSEIEFEAMSIIDKEEKVFNPHQSVLSLIVQMVNKLAIVEVQQKQKYIRNKQ